MKRYFLFILACLTLGMPGISSGKSLEKDESIVFFPTNAYLAGPVWIIPVHGWVFEKEHDSLWRQVIIENFPALLEIEPDESSQPIYEQRAHLFLVDNKRNREIQVKLADQYRKMAASEANGHFQGYLFENRHFMRKNTGQNWITFRAIIPSNDRRKFYGKAQLIKPTGISVISDIDDTIKVSNVEDKTALLQNTFFKEFTPVPGMADAYHSWQQQGVVFHYLSASPWHLYPALAGFIKRSGFPEGSFNLKNFRMKDETFFNLFSSQEEYKKPVVENLLKKYPGRKFILIGDGGEEDPEIFAAVARSYPQQVLHIFIRDLKAGSNQSERYQTTFKGISDSSWTLFHEGSELLNYAIPGTAISKR